jgi:hypothetical protein
MREQAQSLWKVLDKSAHCIINGPPGTGKSSLVWAWACYRGSVCKEHTVWMHYGHFGGVTMVVLNGSEGRVIFSSILDDLMNDLIKLVRAKSNNPVNLIVDGITKKNSTIIGSLHTYRRLYGAKIIIVTSLSLITSIQEFPGWKEFTMFGWTFQDYKQACAHPPFYNTVKSNLEELVNGKEEEDVDNLLKNRFFLAGHCARWFFNFDIKSTIADIDKNLCISEAYLQNLIGSRDGRTANTLLSSFGHNEQCIVSEYATRYFTLKCKFSIISGFLNQAAVKKNPAFQGWVVELAFLIGLRTAVSSPNVKEIKVFNGEVEESWTVHGITEDLDPKDVEKNLLDSGWCIPKCWKQGGYDAFQLTKMGSSHLLRVVQVTRAEAHPFKLEYVCELLKGIHSKSNPVNIEYLDIVMLYPKLKIKRPECTNITGDYHLANGYSDYTTKVAWKKKDIRFLAFDICPYQKNFSST